MKIAPSIIAADFARLGEQVRAVAASGADWLHVDVMDGRFVPNITIGPLVVSALRRETALPLDVHLMIVEPERYLEAFAAAGAQRISVHVEACVHLHRSIAAIQALGCHAGVALNPATPLSALEEILPLVDQVVVMSVNPGFSGQRYIPATTGKIRRLRAMLAARGARAEIVVDGGINSATAAEAAAAGATVLVAATAVFGGGDIGANIAALRGAGGVQP